MLVNRCRNPHILKKLLSTLLLFSSIFAFGQTVPQGINYQAIALDQMGQPVPGHDIVGRPIQGIDIDQIQLHKSDHTVK